MRTTWSVWIGRPGLPGRESWRRKGHTPCNIHRQITIKIFWLQADPRPPDGKRMGIGYRVDVGEYRVFYTVDDEQELVTVELVGPGNDDRIYKLAERLGLL